MSTDVVICNLVRTPVGRYGGVLKELTATQLGAHVLSALVERTGVDPGLVDDVVFGQCYPSGESPAIGRVAALDAGFPVTVPGLQIDRRCGSGLQAVIDAVARVTAGGRNHPVPGGMLETAENLRRQYGISREAQDEWSLRSHQRAVAAGENGWFSEEIVPVTVPGRRGAGDTLVGTDEHPRADATLEGLAGLRPVLSRVDPEATVTAGNASGQNDGAAACIVTTAERADELGLTPMVRLLGWAVAGVGPEVMGIGPVPSVALALKRSGLELADIDLLEVNEAFAAQVLACFTEWGLTASDLERVNVNGSGISLGHPVGATGVRILSTLAHEMRRRNARYGLETMCIGGGQGLAAIFERVV
jgi:acetyl-CoA C-acetyltransferase